MNSKNLQFDIIGSINDEIYAALKNYIYSQPEPISKLTVNIISVGGSVTPAIGIYNFLKSLPFHIHTHNLGEVSSAAISALKFLYIIQFLFTPSPFLALQIPADRYLEICRAV